MKMNFLFLKIIGWSVFIYLWDIMYVVHSVSFQIFYVLAFQIVVDSWNVIAIHLMRWLANFYDFRFKWTTTAGIGIHPTKAWLSQLWISKMQYDTFEERYAIKFCFKLGKNAMRWKLDLLLWPRDQKTMLALPDSRRPDRANPPTNIWWTFFFFFFDSTGIIYLHWVPTGQTVNKEYYIEVLREFRKRLLGKRPALFKSGQWHFYLDNTPVHNCILVSDYLTKIGIKTVPQPPYNPDLAPCDFWLFVKVRGCRFETIEEIKEARTYAHLFIYVRTHTHTHTHT